MNTLKNLKPMYGGGEITPTNYANGGIVGYENGGFLEGLQKLQSMQEFYGGEGPRTESGDLKFGPRGMITREGLAEQYNFPLEEAVFDTLYGAPGSGDMAIDINIPSEDRLIKHQRSGRMSGKKGELQSKSAKAKQALRKSFPEEYLSLATDIGFGDYAGAAEKVGSGWLDMSPLERMRSKTSKMGRSADQEPSREQLLRNKMLLEQGYSQEKIDALNAMRSRLGYQDGGPVESQTLKDIVEPHLPTKEDMLPYLEFLTGASAETESYKPGAVDLALSLPLLGGVGKGAAKGIKKLLRMYGKEGRKLDKIYGKGTAKQALQPGMPLTTKTKYYREMGVDSPNKVRIDEDALEALRREAGDDFGVSGSRYSIVGAEGKYPPGFGGERHGAVYGKSIDDYTGDVLERFRLSPTGKALPTSDVFQQGGMVGYQAGGPVQGAPAQPQPQPQNNLQIDERQANPQMYQGSALGTVQEQVMMLQDSIMQADSVKIQATEDKARKSLMLIKLQQALEDGIIDNPQPVEQPSPFRMGPRMIPTPNEADQIRNMMIGNFSI